MAIGVVDVFEVIDIEQDGREGVAFPRLAGAFAAKGIEAPGSTVFRHMRP
jgi:hypothetical protein